MRKSALDAVPLKERDDYLNRFRRGEWRDSIFRDMILTDVHARGPKPTVLDIGCGSGFDGNVPMLRSLAAEAGIFWGVEPDAGTEPDECFTRVYREAFETAPIRGESVDVAFAVMVLEHLADPRPFLARLADVLVPGGVFWGMTVDDRHWFTTASKWMEKLYLKDKYLRYVAGSGGQKQYENYAVHYRCNNPLAVQSLSAGLFRSCHCLNLSRVGECEKYFPAFLRPALHAWDRRWIAANRPGPLLAVRLEK